VQANGEIIWIGTSEVVMHPRAVVVDRDVSLAAVQRLRVDGLTPWRPPAQPRAARSAAAVRAGCAMLHREFVRVGEPKGFAVMLCRRRPAAPFDRAAIAVRKFAHAFRRGAGESVYDAALPLLGLGTGLTPSGDDLVGAALFARLAIAASASDAQAWTEVSGRLIDAAQTRSHAIGAALFRDLASGESFAALHQLATIVADPASHSQAIDAARVLTAIGHSSGWDMLAGFIVGATGNLTAAPKPLLKGT
jgi:hypothetical protein